MTDPYANIRRALEMGPTPGPWKAHDPSESGWMDITNAPYATPLCYAVPYSDYQYDAELDCKRWVSRAHETPANAAHISACDPDTIRALLAERDALAQENEAMRRCAIKYLSWLDVVHKPLDKALREDMANPDMCGDAAIDDAAMQRAGEEAMRKMFGGGDVR